MLVLTARQVRSSLNVKLSRPRTASSTSSEKTTVSSELTGEENRFLPSHSPADRLGSSGFWAGSRSPSHGSTGPAPVAAGSPIVAVIAALHPCQRSTIFMRMLKKFTITEIVNEQAR